MGILCGVVYLPGVVSPVRHPWPAITFWVVVFFYFFSKCRDVDVNAALLAKLTSFTSN